MNMIPTATPYAMPSFDPAYFNYAAYPLNQMYPQASNYSMDYTKSDSNSDESMIDNKIDHKLSPKYREKRMKNNEAAKKSRLNRKHRENELRETNTKLKAQIEEMQKIIVDLKRELEIVRSESNVHYQDRLMPNCDETSKYGGQLRDITNQHHIAQHHDLQQQQQQQLMASNELSFNFKPM